MPPRHWRLRIEDILGAIERIQRYTADQTLESFSETPLIADAVQLNFQTTPSPTTSAAATAGPSCTS